MSDVSVIGAGAMGSALVEVVAGSGAEVTVWNRTREKAEALSGPRVRVAESVADTLSSSPLTLVVVADHELARNLVDEAGVDLRGKVVASTSPVTPDQARAFDAVVSAAGGHYLDLGILAGAGEVRSGDGVFFVSGDRAAYEAHRGWFERIGTSTYVDDVPGAAYVSGSAVIIGYLPMEVCLLQGLRICKQHEFSSEWFKDAVLEFYPRQIRLLLDLLAETPDPSAAEVEASVDVMRDWADELAVLLRGMGLDSGMYDALHRLFAAASTAGHGDDAWTRIAEHTTTGTGGPSPDQ
ncbi:NAD(P)-binding domain-containing protein [Agromyces sp. SYSU K20354]|uniref:NAD(P)-binding domain-containing protein n=1 Tax=Agromyces cavernae TaxID=2898659 RepID=UPI001E37C660|nr:NAD(P)-binding domain-containing protein [Agromyces cavernae]MCD2441220.1 NAD(P)-binding domain-containing protein [Agromyces cavernae]